MIYRIGHGYDVHKFTDEKDFIILGGIRIAHNKGLLAHSDGDVVLHAVCDALLGAAGLDDIGNHFPDTEIKYKDKDSSFFVKETMLKLKTMLYEISNIDITIAAEAPKINIHRDKIRRNIAQLLQIKLDSVNVKATTTEKLGFIGRKEGISATAVTLIYKNS